MCDMKNCEECNGPFEAKRVDARFCSPRCRKRQSRSIEFDRLTGNLAVRKDGPVKIFTGEADEILVALKPLMDRKGTGKCGHPISRDGMCSTKRCSNSVYAR